MHEYYFRLAADLRAKFVLDKFTGNWKKLGPTPVYISLWDQLFIIF